jgi:hypothetical protein
VTNRRRQSVLAIVAGLAAFSAGEGAEPPASVYGLPLVVSRPVAAALVSGAQAQPAGALAPLSDGAPLSYQQFPPILDPGETGSIRIRVDVIGDVPVVRFRRNVPTQPTGNVEEEWSRVTTRSVSGRLISVFEETYPPDVLSDILVYPHGNDFPQVPLGRLEAPGGGESASTVWLRVAPSNLPASTVRRIASPDGEETAAQYASHVVNLVLPGFDDARVGATEDGYALDEAAQAFYQHFADQYQSLAFVPTRMPLAAPDDFQRTVLSDIRGIGLEARDDRAAFGGVALRAVELLPAGLLGHHATLLHQLAHHWGDDMDLGTIAGIAPPGDAADRHTPLLYPGVTLLGGVLDGTRHVERAVTSAGVESFTIGRPSAPAVFHSLQLYRMGLLSPTEVPELTVFTDQTQLGPPRASSPAVGTAVVGESRSVDMNAIVAALGTREGPVFTDWHQAVIVVSDAPVSQVEMDYYNFFAQRAEAQTGTRAYDGFGSFHEATGGRANLHTAIVTRDPAVHPMVSQPLDVGDVPFGAGDWRGLLFDEALPSRVQTSTTLTLSGRIDPDVLPGSYQFLVVRASRLGDAPDEATTAQTSVSGGRFAVSLRFPAAGAGAYALDAFVFVDVAATPVPTSVLTPLFVD